MHEDPATLDAVEQESRPLVHADARGLKTEAPGSLVEGAGRRCWLVAGARSRLLPAAPPLEVAILAFPAAAAAGEVSEVASS